MRRWSCRDGHRSNLLLEGIWSGVGLFEEEDVEAVAVCRRLESAVQGMRFELVISRNEVVSIALISSLYLPFRCSASFEQAKPHRV